MALEGVSADGVLADGWGEVSAWPAERVTDGDWSAAAWRSPVLAEAGARFAEHGDLAPMTGDSERERERNFQDWASAQRQLPQDDAHGGRGRLMVHATLQTLYADYHKAVSGASQV
ncbi:MAG: hypothetical protein OXG52_12405 [bacterium]|nr:hypothetical protein [bacterium]